MTPSMSSTAAVRPRLGRQQMMCKGQPKLCRSDASVWQDLAQLEVLGVIELLVNAFDNLEPKQRRAIRLVCKSWAVHFPVRDLVASSRDFKCVSGSHSCTSCPSVGMCVCKLEKLRGLARVDIHCVNGPAESCLRALQSLPSLRELSISFDPSARISSAVPEDSRFPSTLDSLRIFGYREGMFTQIARLTRLTTLELHGTPRYSSTRHHVPDISLVQALPRLRSLAVEYWPGWPRSSYASLERLTTLERLSLVGFSAPCLQAISRLPNLKKLELSYDGDCPTWLDFDSRVSIAPCDSLEVTTLELCNASSDMCQILLGSLCCFHISMKSIEFSSCGFDTSAARGLLPFSKLETLTLDGGETSETILETLRPLTRLNSLSLSGIPLSNFGMKSLQAFQELKCLDRLCHRAALNGGFSMVALDNLVAALPKLECLGIDVTITAPSLHGRPSDAARELEQHVLQYSGLSCSVKTDLCFAV